MTAAAAQMNKQQQEAVEHNDGPLLIVAGAGTGKTMTLVEKVNHLIEHEMALPHEILALTFTDKAAHEMEERVDARLPYGFTQTWISTFHSFADQLLRQHALEIGLNPGYRLMSQAETVSFFRECLFKFELKHYRPLGNPNKFIGALLQHFSRLHDEDITPETYQKWASDIEASDETDEEKNTYSQEDKERYIELSNAYAKYQQIKMEKAVFDYADLLYYLLQLLRSRPSILKNYQKLFKYILVDEFQDTNIAQYELIKLLCPPTKRDGPHLTVVGDDSQAIYKFRGASVSNILAFMSDYPHARQVSLNANYRSSQTILDQAYILIKHNDPDTLEARLGISKELTAASKHKNNPIELFIAQRIEDEATHVAQSILNHAKSYAYSDIAILVRANTHAEAFTRQLGQQGIPFQLHGPSALFKNPHVKDLIAYLNILAAAEDNASCYRVLQMQIFTLDPRELAYVVSFAKKTALPLTRAIHVLSELTAQTNPPEYENYRTHLPTLTQASRDALATFNAMYQKHLGAIKTLTAGQILFQFLEDTNFLKQLMNKGRDDKMVIAVSQFFDRLKSYEATHEDASVHAVAEFLKMSMELGESPNTLDTDLAEQNAVHILTVHGSKGLEFPVVYLVNLSQDRFPTRARSEAIPIPTQLIKEELPEGNYHIEEERRLFYVAMTRAKDHLHLSASRFYHEGKRVRKLSKFIEEALGAEVVAKTEAKKESEKQQLSIFDFKPQDSEGEKKPESPAAPSPAAQDSHLQVSYSQLDTYALCPLRYKYQYILKVPTSTNAAASFGSSIHAALQYFYQEYKSNPSANLDSLLAHFERAWIPIGYSSQAHEAKRRKEGVTILTDFYNKYHTSEIQPLDLERFFKIKLEHSLSITGKIDRVDQLDEKNIEIIDYKTGKKPEERTLKKSLQLSIYAMAAMESATYGAHIDNIHLTFYYLQSNEKITLKRSLDDIVSTKEKLHELTTNMKDSDYTPKKGHHCSFCPFKMLCEAW